LTAITKEAWNIAANTEDKREKIQALSLAKECYSMKLDLLTNATVVEDAIRFISSNKSNKSKDNLTSSDDNNGVDKEESNETDHDADKDQYKIEGKQEEEDGETTITINQVF
jgi:hypothetical protein